MNEVETLRTLLSEQIKRNADLHALLAQQIADVNEARRERDAAWKGWTDAINGWDKEIEKLDEARRERDDAIEELSRVRKELVSANRGAERNAKVNQGLCSKLAIAELERDDALEELNVWRELNLLIAKLKEKA